MAIPCSTLFAVLAVVIYGADAARFDIENRLGYMIWVGSFAENNLTPDGGGWEMAPGSKISLTVDDSWNGRFWARTGCSFDGDGNGHCETGDCGNKLKCNGATGERPATLAEFKLKGHEGLDFYDVSNVDGFNVPVTINPLDKTGEGYSCTPAKCTANINEQCPQELQVVGGSGQVVGCKSACAAFNTPQYCCEPPFETPETCKSSEWPVDYPAIFKGLCPDAYSYAYDDHKSTWTCSETAYAVIFG